MNWELKKNEQISKPNKSKRDNPLSRMTKGLPLLFLFFSRYNHDLASDV